MDRSFLIAVVVALGFVSLMVAVRLGASGAGAGRLVWPLAELWLVVAVWVGLFWWLSSAMGPPAEAGAAAELRHLPARFGRLSASSRLGGAVWLAACVAGIAHLMWMLRRIMGHSAG